MNTYDKFHKWIACGLKDITPNLKYHCNKHNTRYEVFRKVEGDRNFRCYAYINGNDKIIDMTCIPIPPTDTENPVETVVTYPILGSYMKVK